MILAILRVYMTVYNYDPTTALYIYRLENQAFLVGVIMGGSWARSTEYLQCGYQLSLSPGIRHPDVGFRPVREPKDSDWSIQHRKLCAISLGEGKIMLSWALLDSDNKSTELEVFYVVESSMHAGVYMVDANSGEIIWKLNREDDPRWTHGHHGWTSDIWSGSAGIECISNRAGHSDQKMILFSADGRVLLEPFPFGLTPVEWDGDLTR